jgi:apolipoprotein N-acyltransferase
MNVFRAAENRKNIIVVSNTGISGVIDCCGRIIKKTKNEEEICFTSEVYTNIYITSYDRTGDIIVYLSLFFACGILIFVIFSKIKKRI